MLMPSWLQRRTSRGPLPSSAEPPGCSHDMRVTVSQLKLLFGFSGCPCGIATAGLESEEPALPQSIGRATVALIKSAALPAMINQGIWPPPVIDPLLVLKRKP
ncbi:hypothetical protein HNQ75_001299 [Rhizobium flavum]|uniref:Uncharacterized protein n=1 Tax=Pseudorhizobium flavum TaxID=1335061 RepID=A0A7X0DC90_9HYPH|nr:hypothetical protein [Pseudorhizobium flavum]CAD6604669.1 hypothetical protein RFYW14_01613 [Pseudorhizobium flavum]